MRALLLFLVGCSAAPADLQPPPPASPGDPPAVGWKVGNQAGMLPVARCDTGAPAAIEFGTRATWIFVAHTHCPTCQATADFTPDVAKSLPEGVLVVHVVHDDSGVSCAEWRTRHELGGLPNVRIYADPSGAAYDAVKKQNVTAPSVFLDENKTVTYVAHGLTQSNVTQQIDAALAR